MRAKLKIDTDDIRAANPNIIMARGSGAGPKGPEAHKGGYDGASVLGRGGVGVSMPDREGWPPGQPTPAFGDVMGGLTTAGAIAAALLERGTHRRAERGRRVAAGHRHVAGVAHDHRLEAVRLLQDPQGDRTRSPNPGVGTYRTSDDRFIALILLQSDKHWVDLICERLGVPELATDPRFCDSAAQYKNGQECIARSTRPSAPTRSYWKEQLATFEGVWSPFQTLDELYDNVQVQADRLPAHHDRRQRPGGAAGGQSRPVRRGAHHRGASTRARRAHRAGPDGPRLRLLDQIAAMKESGAVL